LWPCRIAVARHDIRAFGGMDQADVVIFAGDVAVVAVAVGRHHRIGRREERWFLDRQIAQRIE